MRQNTVESCALDGEGYIHRERGAGGAWAIKEGVANITWPIQDGERDTRISSVIRRD